MLASVFDGFALRAATESDRLVAPVHNRAIAAVGLAGAKAASTAIIVRVAINVAGKLFQVCFGRG